MGLNVRRRVLLKEAVLKNCDACHTVYPEDCNFCKKCGNKLSSQRSKVYANFGKNGITSVTYKMPNGITINSKGNVTVPLASGISYTSKLSK